MTQDKRPPVSQDRMKNAEDKIKKLEDDGFVQGEKFWVMQEKISVTLERLEGHINGCDESNKRIIDAIDKNNIDIRWIKHSIIGSMGVVIMAMGGVLFSLLFGVQL